LFLQEFQFLTMIRRDKDASELSNDIMKDPVNQGSYSFMKKKFPDFY